MDHRRRKGKDGRTTHKAADMDTDTEKGTPSPSKDHLATTIPSQDHTMEQSLEDHKLLLHP